MSKIVEPLPLLPIKYKNQELIGNLPKFGHDKINSDLGLINGHPVPELIFDE